MHYNHLHIGKLSCSRKSRLSCAMKQSVSSFVQQGSFCTQEVSIDL